MFDITSITSLEECTRIRTYLQRKKSDLDFEKTQSEREAEGTLGKAQSIPNQIIQKESLLLSFQNQLTALPAGPSAERTQVEREIMRCQVQIGDLTERLSKNGKDEVFEAHAEAEFSAASLAIVETYIPLVETKFTELGGVAA